MEKSGTKLVNASFIFVLVEPEPVKVVPVVHIKTFERLRNRGRLTATKR